MKLFCQRTSCEKLIVDLSGECQFSSISARCVCGARYRVSYKSGMHAIEHVNIEDLTLASITDIENDPSVKPGDKVLRLQSLIKRAKSARSSYQTAYGELIHKAEEKEKDWHTKSSEGVTEALNTKSEMSSVELVNMVAVAHTASGQPLFVENEPWNPARMSEPSYVKQVAEELEVTHILGE